MTEKKIRDLIGSGDVWTQQFCIPVESAKIINNNRTATKQKEMQCCRSLGWPQIASPPLMRQSLPSGLCGMARPFLSGD